MLLGVSTIPKHLNLATARSAGRAREVGLRKVVGAYRGQLIGQFLGESVLLALLSLGIAIGFVQLALPFFNPFVGKDMAFLEGGWMITLAGLVGIALCVWVLAGSYPAFFLSAFRPVEVLKGTQGVGLTRSWFRKGLVVFQFAISIVLIVWTVTVLQLDDVCSEQEAGFSTDISS